MQDMFGVSTLWKLHCFVLLTRLNLDRCTLTFFAIQEPGISRYCDTCRREYLHEDYALNDHSRHGGKPAPGTKGMETSDNATMEGNVVSFDDESILQVLFRNYDVCIFCGGKFIG